MDRAEERATTGHNVFAVNPHMQTFDGDRCYPDVQSIPGGADGVVIVTRPDVTERIVHQCSDAGVRHVWMHQSLAKGSFRRRRSSTAVSTTSA